jgi:hypothetical protein
MAQGEKIPLSDPRKQRFLEWLCTIKDDRQPRLQKDLAAELGVNPMTLSTWRNEDAEFLAEWTKRYRKTIGSPERMQHVLDQLYATATDRTDPRQVAAAKEYRLAVEGVAPARLDVNVNSRELSDEALAELIAETAAKEVIERADRQ